MKPILFNTEMVRAILEGQKTQTRRVVKPQPEGGHTATGYDSKTDTFEIMCGNGGEGGLFLDWGEARKPPYSPGDILWVRETWNYGYIETSDQAGSSEAWFEELWKPATGYLGALSGYFYRADCDLDILPLMTWRPSIHMPREAARIFLRVTDVRVERLQEIDEAGVLAEGLTTGAAWAGDMEIAAQEFALLWDSTIEKADLDRYGWAANPWVWVIEFERIEAGKVIVMK